MVGGWAVADLAPDPAVIGGQALFGDRRMTESALLMPSVLLLVRNDRVDCRCTVMAQVTERIGDQH